MDLKFSATLEVELTGKLPRNNGLGHHGVQKRAIHTHFEGDFRLSLAQPADTVKLDVLSKTVPPGNFFARS